MSDSAILQELSSRLSKLEQENGQMAQELAIFREERKTAHTALVENVRNSKTTKPKLRNRRNLFSKGLGVAATVLGMSIFVEANSGTAHASGAGNFSSSVASIPALTATGTNGAIGVSVITDTGNGVAANTTHGVGVAAHSVTSYGVTASSNYGAGLFASGRGEAIFAQGGPGYGLRATSGNYGVETTSTGSYGLHATGASSAGAIFAEGGAGTGLYATSTSGNAIKVDGYIAVQGNSVGTATLLAGSDSVTVTSAAATTASVIVLTPLAQYKGNLWVTRATGSFSINSSQTESSDLQIAYLIIN